MKLEKIYTAQSYLNEEIIQEKIENEDFEIQVELIKDDDEMIPILVDGNHSLEAAKRTGNKVEITVIEGHHKNMNLEEYVEAFNDLSNPINIVTGNELW